MFKVYEFYHKYLYPGHLDFVETVPALSALLALMLTGGASWDCHYFEGASISFTGADYGIWGLESQFGDCELYDTIFFAYELGPHLRVARAFSMMAMLLGMGIFVTMIEALRFHLVSFLVGFAFLILLIISLATSSLYNLWICFFMFSYIIITLIVRALFVHPVYRRISVRGSKIVAGVSAFCGVCVLLTMVVLGSDFCTCENLTSDRLEGRDPGDPCEGTCRLRATGYLTIAAAFFWFLNAYFVAYFSVQPKRIFNEMRENKDFAHYPRDSFTTRAVKGARRVAQAVSFGSSMSNHENSSEGALKEKSLSISAPEKDVDAPDSEDMNPISPEDEGPDNRSRCSRYCCDYRVSKRTTKQRILFWSFRVLLGFIVAMYIFILVVLMGSRFENTQAAKAPSTSPAFVTPVVCAWNPLNRSAPYENFETKDDAVAAGYEVAHCGECGYCSNPLDIQTYVYTRETIADTSKECKGKVLFGSRPELTRCLMDKIGFSQPCAECWSDNMINTADKCLYTCMKTLFTGFMGSNNVAGASDTAWMNQCLYCDEKMSGPGFVSCSGVVRRRLGIVSEIERNPEEQCRRVDIDWLDVDWEEVFGIPS